MPTTTYTPLANITLASTTSNVTFTSISQAYRDLVLVINGNNSTGADLLITLNGLNSNYNTVLMRGSGTAATSSTTSSDIYVFIKAWGSGTSKSNAVVNFMDYSVTDKHKSFLMRQDNAGAWGSGAVAGRWASTAAITSIAIDADGSTMAVGTSLALYGIAA